MAARVTVSPAPSDFPVQPRPTLAFRAARRLLRGIGRRLFRVEVRGVENLAPGQGYVVIANHLQWIDAFAVVAALPSQPRIHVFGDLLGIAPWQMRVVRRIGGVIPVGLCGTRELWLRKRLTVTVGAPMSTDGHSPESLTAAARNAVLGLLTEKVDRGGRRLLARRLTTLF